MAAFTILIIQSERENDSPTGKLETQHAHSSLCCLAVNGERLVRLQVAFDRADLLNNRFRIALGERWGKLELGHIKTVHIISLLDFTYIVRLGVTTPNGPF